MNPQSLIEAYRDEHAGKSEHIDSQMTLAEQAIKDAARNQDRGDKDFTLVNLYIARNTLNNLLQAIPRPDALRRNLVIIYSAIDNQICEEQEKR
jgi:hypothetical protein